MYKLVIIWGIALFTIIVLLTYVGNKAKPRPNMREYQIELEMDYYIIYDGNRVVDTLPYGDCPIDKVFAADNY